MKQNVAYLRVSTEAQTEKYGLDVQKEKILKYCKNNNIAIAKWYIDGGYSGSKLERPKMQELLEDSKNGLIQTVYIYKLDRMSRDVIDTLNLLYRILPSYGVQVVSMTEEIKTENPMDKVMVGVNAIMGQYEREVIYMRTRAGMLERVKKGLWMGGGNLPYGYYYDRNDGILHPNEYADDVPKIFKMYNAGYSCEKIAVMLSMKENTIRQILKHKVFIGMIEYKGEVYQGKHEPLVDKETFYETQKLMKSRENNSYICNKYLLTGLVVCGVCGARMRYHKWGGKPKLVCYSQLKGKDYMARDRNCDNEKVFSEDIDRQIDEEFKNFVIHVSDRPVQTLNNIDIINGNIEKINAKIKKLYHVYAESDSEQLLDVIREEEDNVKKLKEQLSKEKETYMHSDTETIKEIRRVSDAWDIMTDSEKNKILKKCIEKVVITHNDVEVFFYFD